METEYSIISCTSNPNNRQINLRYPLRNFVQQNITLWNSFWLESRVWMQWFTFILHIMFFSQIRHLCKHFFSTTLYIYVSVYIQPYRTQVNYLMLLLLHTVQFSHCNYLHSYNKYNHVHPFVSVIKNRDCPVRL